MNPSTQAAREALGNRLDDLEQRATFALVHNEGRDGDQINAALRAVLGWITTGGAAIEETLTWPDFELDLMIDYVRWTDQQIPLSIALGLQASPEWDYQEIFAVVALCYVVLAQDHFESKTSRGSYLAAMAYADAVDHFSNWQKTRGRGASRNPAKHEVAFSDAMDKLIAMPFVIEARTEQASRGGKSRASARAMKVVEKEWYELIPTRRYPGDSAFAKQAQGRHPEITNVRSIQTNIPKWKAARKKSLNQ